MSRPAAPVHTDHPLRHWDRTCPACLAEYEAEHQPESETPEPETDALLKARPALWGGWNSADLHALEMHARSLERRLRLAQTEIKGHMRVVDDLQGRIAELEKDAARLDWLERFVFDRHWDGTIGRPAYWRMAGPYRHELAKMLGSTLRDAIDAALQSRA